MGLRWVTASDELGALRLQLSGLEATVRALHSEWVAVQGELEELHRRNLNVIRSLRRAASHHDARTDDAEGYDAGEATVDELTRARRAYGG
jgi:hypothetical protein